MAGELEIAVVGRTARLNFLSDHIVLQIADYRSAAAIIRVPTPDLGPLGKLLNFSEMKILAQVGKRKPIDIFPKPARIARWLSPKVRELNGTDERQPRQS